MKKIIILFVSLFLINSASMIQAQETEPIPEQIQAQETEPLPEQKVQKTELTKAEKDSILYAKLSAEQIVELELEKILADSGNKMPMSNFSIIMICMLPFAFVIIIVYLNLKKKNTESRQRYEVYMKSLEMGQTIPEHFFDQPKQNGKASNLKRGIILLMLGLAFGVFAIIDSNTSLFILLAAIIPGFVGVAYLLIHKLEKPTLEDKKDEQI